MVDNITKLKKADPDIIVELVKNCFQNLKSKKRFKKDPLKYQQQQKN